MVWDLSGTFWDPHGTSCDPLVAIQVLLGVVEVLRVGAVHVVPPVAREERLAEEGEVGAEVGVEAAALLADVKQLQLKMAVGTHKLIAHIQGSAKRSADFVKQQLGRARQKS